MKKLNYKKEVIKAKIIYASIYLESKVLLKFLWN